MALDSEIADWVARRTVGLSLESGELIPPESLRGVRILGLAECTHGTREFFLARRRLLEDLADKSGFNTVAIEASAAAVEPLDEYLATGTGDLARLVTDLRFVMWDVEEFVETLRWIRQHNAGHGPSRRIRLVGLDIWNTAAIREQVLEIVAKRQPKLIEDTRKVFEVVARSESGNLLQGRGHIDEGLHRQVGALAANLDEPARSRLRMVEQWIHAHLTDVVEGPWPAGMPRQAGLSNFARSVFMAENLSRVLDADPDARVCVWAHIFHLAAGFPDPVSGMATNMGSLLKQRWGDTYRVLAMETGAGRYLARAWDGDVNLGGLVVGDIAAPVEDTLLALLARSGHAVARLDLVPPLTPSMQACLEAPQPAHAISWLRREGSNPFRPLSLAGWCHGILYVHRTHPTTPTANGVETVAGNMNH